MRLASLALVLLALPACSMHRAAAPDAPPVPVPGAYAAQVADANAGDPLDTAWWSQLGDPALASLQSQLLQDNLQVQAMHHRLTQVQSFARQARAGYWPQVNADISMAQRLQRLNFGADLPGVDLSAPTTVESLSASLSAGYELDMWQRVDDRVDAAELDVLAMKDQVESLNMALTANLAEAWYDLVSDTALLELIDAQTGTNERFLELVELRFESGLASALDVHQQKSQLTQLRAQRALVSARHDTAAHRIALLLGRVPGTVELPPPGDFPTLPPPPKVGVPADLLTRRPDVRAARRSVEATDHRISAAIGDRLPSLRLSGSVGLSPSEPKDFIESPVWSWMVSLGVPIWDGGRQYAEIDRQRAIREEKLIEFAQAFVQATFEVENALTLEARQREHIGDLGGVLEAAQNTLREARGRYESGLSDYLPVLQAIGATQRAEQSLLTARRQLISYRIQLYRALGGAWTASASDVVANREGSQP